MKSVTKTTTIHINSTELELLVRKHISSTYPDVNASRGHLSFRESRHDLSTSVTFTLNETV